MSTATNTDQPTEKCLCLDGNTAVAQAVIKFISFAAIFPITPSSTVSELVEQYAAQGKRNIFNQRIKVIQAQSELGAIGACHGALINGALCSTFTSSQGLLLMIPNLYHIANEKLPFVLHVACRTVGMISCSILADHSDIYSLEGTNMPVIWSCNVQECYDIAIISHLCAIKCQCAFAHSYEGYRVSHQLESVQLVNDDVIHQILDISALIRWKNNGIISTDRPFGTNINLGAEATMQLIESKKFDFDQVPNQVEQILDKFYQITKRRYKTFEYYGDAAATTVIVIMGSAGSTVQLVVQELVKKQQFKIGVIRIRLFRPFDTQKFALSLPKTCNLIITLDRAAELVQSGGTLAREISFALHKEKILSSIRYVNVCSGRYGIGGLELLPQDVLSICQTYCGNSQESIQSEFVCGIIDDLRNKSLLCVPIQEQNRMEQLILPKQVQQSILYGIGSDGTIGAARNAVQILQNTASNIQVQCQFNFDGKKSGGLTMSHIRLYKGDDEAIKTSIRLAEYEILNCQYIGCHHEEFIFKFTHMFEALQENGIVVINVSCEENMTAYANKNLPSKVKKDIAQRRARLFMINANKVANDVGIPGRTNNIMILFYFKYGMQSLIDFNDAVTDMKLAAKKTYSKRGQAVIDANIQAIDKAVSFIDQCEIKYEQDQWINCSDVKFDQKLSPFCPEYDNFVKTVIDPMSRREFEKLTTRVMYQYNNGFFPNAYESFDKQKCAIYVPHWNKENCIQCAICATACPHSTVRPYVFESDSEIAKTKPINFDTMPFKRPTQSLGLKQETALFSIQISAADCRGCEVCAKACPKNCFEMRPIKDELLHQDNYEWAHNNLSFEIGKNLDGMNSNFTELMLRPYYVEYCGSCPGCPESVLLKLLGQIIGNSLIVQTGVGCSLVWSGSGLMRPFSMDKNGRGIASSSSLFENGSVFHWGSIVAKDNERQNIKEFLISVSDKISWSETTKHAVEELITNYEDKQICWKHVDNLRILLGLKEASTSQRICCGQICEDKIVVSQQQSHDLIQMLCGEVQINQELFTNYIKMNNLILSKNSTWFYAGDGAVYDIDFGGIDHIIHNHTNTKVLVFCNQVFANTGGQVSKNSFIGQVQKNCYNGVENPEKQLGLMMIAAYGTGIYIAQVSHGYNRMQAIKAIREAEQFEGPAVVLCYCPCISHMLNGGMSNSEKQQKLAVLCGMWPVFRWNGSLEPGKRMTIEFQKTIGVDEFICNEQRFMSLKQRDQQRYVFLKGKLEANVKEVLDKLEKMKTL